MSQTSAAPGPAVAVAPAPAGQLAPPAPATEAAARPDRPVSDTPRRLRALGSGVLWAGVVFGVAGLLTFALLAAALARAGDSTAQLIRMQQIQTDLLSADANATNAFLVGGLEPPPQRQAYAEAIASATGLIAQAARAEPADGEALAALNEQLVTYTATIEQARANNRQGFPVGAQYLRTASTGLRADALPILDNLVSANADRSASQMDAREGWLLGVVGLLVLTGLVLGQVWLARRFRRRINPWVAAATGLLLLTWLAGLVGLVVLGTAAQNIRTGAFADVNASATARIQAYNAKSNESLTLVARGSGQAFEKAWQTSSAAVSANAPAPTRAGQAWQGYVRVHQQIRSLDDGGQWDAAVRTATGTGADSANTTFAAFDSAVSADVQRASTETTEGLASSRVGLVLAALAILAAGVAAGLLARRGVEQRLREYR